VGDYAFDADTSVSPSGPGEYTATLTDRWDGMSSVVNGGYMMAIGLRALGLSMPFPDPIVVSGMFLRPGTAGPVTVRTSLLRSGRTTAFGEASLARQGRELVRVMAAFADLGAAADGPVFLGGGPPDLPPPSDCVGLPTVAFGPATIAERIEFRPAELPGWVRGEPGGRPSLDFWIRFADGRDADLLALPLLVDSTAPSVMELGALSTTIELTVHLRARPAPGWLACRASTRFVTGGYHEEDFEVWDSAGTLVAQSRQLALVVS
jgi:acyl-coenzyme A thioesterase PaaI-like protein